MNHLVITVHGIRTFGDWQERLEQLLKDELNAASGESLEVLNYKYGYFSIIAFLIPPIRWLVVRRFRLEFLRRAKSVEWDRIDIVAHSFGTHLVGWGLHGIQKNERPRIHTVILAGSVLKPSFPWLDLTDSCLHRLANDCGIYDRVLLLNQLVVLFTGMAGRVGFAGMTGSNFRNRFFAFGHSGYFLGPTGPDDSFIRDKWVPLLIADSPIAVFPDPRHSSAVSGLIAFFLNNIEPIKLTVYALPVVALFLFYRSLYITAAAERDRAKSALNETRKTLSRSDFLEALHSINEGKDLDALAQLARSLSVNPENQEATLRLTTLLAYRDHAVPLLTFKNNASFARSPGDPQVVVRKGDVVKPGGRFILVNRSYGPTPVFNPDDSVAARSGQFSPDGKRIVTAWANRETESGEAEIWDAKTGKSLTQPIKHDHYIWSVQFSPDGKRIVTASGNLRASDFTASGFPEVSENEPGEARVWDAETGKLLTEPMRHDHIVCSAQFSPDGRCIVTASEDKTARVWDSQTGAPLTGPMKHDDYVQSAQFSPDGKRIVTASGPRFLTVRVWNAEIGTPVTEPIQQEDHIKSVQFSPNGKRIVTAASKTARVWDAQTGEPVLEPMVHDDEVYSARYSPDGKRIVTASGATDRGDARVWDAETGKLLIGPMKHDIVVVSAQFSTDSRRIVTASGSSDTGSGDARVWDVESGKLLIGPMEHGGGVTSAQFSPDGRRIVTTCSETVRVWNVQNGMSLSEPIKHNDDVVSAQFSPDCKRIMTASNNMVRVWDAQTSKLLTDPMKHDDTVMSAQFSPDGKRIVTASLDHTARVWDAATGKPLAEPLKHDGSVQSALFSPDSKRIVTVSSDTARVWDAATGKPLAEPLKHDGNVQSAQFSQDGTRILTVSQDNTPRVWDAKTGKPLTEPIRPDKSVTSVRFSADGKRIVATTVVYVERSAMCAARVWDAEMAKPLTGPMKHGGSVRSAQFSSDGRRLVTASDDGTARIWDAGTGRPLTESMRHAESVRSAQFSPDGKRILTTSNKTARVWDLHGMPLSEPMKHDDGVVSAQFSPDGKRILTTSNKTARVWDLMPAGPGSPEWLPLLADAIAQEHLSDRGVFESVKKDPADVVKEIKDQVNREPTDDDWITWGRWFLADRSTRMISPFSKITVPEYVEDRIKEKTQASLNEAEQLVVGNAKLLKRITQARETLPKAPNHSSR